MALVSEISANTRIPLQGTNAAMGGSVTGTIQVDVATTTPVLKDAATDTSIGMSTGKFDIRAATEIDIGSNTPAGAVAIHNVKYPVDGGDAASKKYVDDNMGGGGGGSFTTQTTTNVQYTDVPNPQVDLSNSALTVYTPGAGATASQINARIINIASGVIRYLMFSCPTGVTTFTIVNSAGSTLFSQASPSSTGQLFQVNYNNVGVAVSAFKLPIDFVPRFGTPYARSLLYLKTDGTAVPGPALNENAFEDAKEYFVDALYGLDTDTDNPSAGVGTLLNPYRSIVKCLQDHGTETDVICHLKNFDSNDVVLDGTATPTIRQWVFTNSAGSDTTSASKVDEMFIYETQNLVDVHFAGFSIGTPNVALSQGQSVYFSHCTFNATLMNVFTSVMDADIHFDNCHFKGATTFDGNIKAWLKECTMELDGTMDLSMAAFLDLKQCSWIHFTASDDAKIIAYSTLFGADTSSVQFPISLEGNSSIQAINGVVADVVTGAVAPIHIGANARYFTGSLTYNVQTSSILGYPLASDGTNNGLDISQIKCGPTAWKFNNSSTHELRNIGDGTTTYPSTDFMRVVDTLPMSNLHIGACKLGDYVIDSDHNKFGVITAVPSTATNNVVINTIGGSTNYGMVSADPMQSSFNADVWVDGMTWIHVTRVQTTVPAHAGINPMDVTIDPLGINLNGCKLISVKGYAPTDGQETDSVAIGQSSAAVMASVVINKQTGDVELIRKNVLNGPNDFVDGPVDVILEWV